MSWLQRGNLRASFRGTRLGSSSQEATPSGHCDPGACYESFCKHWQQADEIISRTSNINTPTNDDVFAVVKHLEHLTTLLLLEIRNNKTTPANGVLNSEDFGSGGQCLEFLLSENLLHKLYDWGSFTSRYSNVVRLEQMKLYSLLITHVGQQLLGAEPFLRPLLKLLNSFKAELLPVDVEGRLICLLGQLCVVLMQNTKYVDLFFITHTSEQGKQVADFVPVTLLISYVHREGPLGQQARSALLLCAALSSRNETVAEYIVQRSNMCLLLPTGLSGLYSLLPRSLDIVLPDWHRLTPDDVNDINKLGLFMNSLEFCNAVVQESHPKIQRQLLDFLYQGFLIPVMGPALLQTSKRMTPQATPSPTTTTTPSTYLQNGVDEQIAAIVYFELVLRSVTEPGLLMSFIKFIIDKSYDGKSILDSIIPLLNGEPRLSMVTLSLLETLIDLNCEDLMLELVFKYLINGNHLMVSQRSRPLDCDFHCKATGMFLDLSPECCSTKHTSSADSRKTSRKTSVSSEMSGEPSSLNSISSKSTLQPLLGYGVHVNESLYGNYHAYLCSARQKISSCSAACKKWSTNYDANCQENVKTKSILTVVNDFQIEHLNLVKENVTALNNHHEDTLYTSKEEDSLHSIGESSGYESFKYHQGSSEEDHTTNEEESKLYSEDSFWRSSKLLSPQLSAKSQTDAVNDISMDKIKDVDIGPLLSLTLEKLNSFLDNDFYVNMRLTGLITRLASYPLPLLKSLLLCPWIVLQPTVTSLYQILVSLKQNIDEFVRKEYDCVRMMEEAQAFLISREIRMANARKNAIESAGSRPKSNLALATTFSQHGVHNNLTDPQSQSNAWEPQPFSSTMQPMSISEQGFKRNEPKRKSLSSSFTSMFSRKITSGGMAGSPSGSPVDHGSPIRSDSASSSYSAFSEDNLWQSSKLRRVIVNAVILDEWLKELAALAQEHVVSSISETINL